MYKMQQQLGTFAKMKSREELEVPTYTATVPASVIQVVDANSNDEA